MKPLPLLVNIDVPDLERAIAFYEAAIGLQLKRRLFNGGAAELLGAASPIYLLANPPGSVAAAQTPRDYRRHWTPVHLDFVVDDLDAATRRAIEAGAEWEKGPVEESYGRFTTFADPFGHGFCLLQFNAGGYDAAEDPPQPA